tara:strand:+ start:573 stop:839 length:267 start_codon:yes stop_codon:yes gene_type:complete
MDRIRYDRLVDKFYNDLDSMKKSLESVKGSRDDTLYEINSSLSTNLTRINNFKVGLNEGCLFYEGFEDLFKEYSNFKNELNSYNLEEA